jgi:hypothetical protein
MPKAFEKNKRKTLKLHKKDLLRYGIPKGKHTLFLFCIIDLIRHCSVYILLALYSMNFTFFSLYT